MKEIDEGIVPDSVDHRGVPCMINPEALHALITDRLLSAEARIVLLHKLFDDTQTVDQTAESLGISRGLVLKATSQLSARGFARKSRRLQEGSDRPTAIWEYAWPSFEDQRPKIAPWPTSENRTLGASSEDPQVEPNIQESHPGGRALALVSPARAGAVTRNRATISEKKEDVLTHTPGQGEVCGTKKDLPIAAETSPAETLSEPAKPKVPKRKRYVYSEDFEIAWAGYERKGEKPVAYAEWTAALERESVETIMNALVEYIEATPFKYRKHLERWLKADMWESAVSGTQQTKQSKVEQIDEEMAKGDFRHVGNREYIQSKIDKMTYEQKVKYGVIRP